MPKKRTKKPAVTTMLSVRLGAAVINAINVLVREESRESGFEFSPAKIISLAVMERYRRRKRKT